MKKFLILALSILLWTASNAQQTRKYSIMEICDIEFDFADAKICGLDSAEFASYYADNKGTSKEYVSLMLKRFSNKFREEYDKNNLSDYDLEPINNGEKATDIYILINNLVIADNAAISGTINLCSIDNTILASADFSVKEGRWNSFENLLCENALTAAQQAKSKLRPEIRALNKRIKSKK